MKGPTICRLPCGSARRTANPSPRSRVRGTMIRSSASQVLGSPSTGSLEGCQLIFLHSKFCRELSMHYKMRRATLPQPDWPGIETERLILRQWRASDVTANTMMLGDPLSARFITADRKPVTEPMAGWRNAAIMAGHWVLHGFGMFVVEEKASGTFVGRVGPFYPPVWPGFEVGWGVAREFRGKGYAVEAARAAINWSFATF